MNEQQVKELLATMNAQTAAINRLAESNEALVALLYQSVADDIETTTVDCPAPTYLSSRPRG
ncbi:hypothetical protein SNN52_000057 [Cronobacter sakazakii]|uniref:hypothetical protein n=1 Tax=Enterobacterales TaxID=91347 RepID=UPI0028941BDB|nr:MULTISPECIES: hypothetical protein [Enterobacterales]EJG0746342.1 hypothetical protein [Cronobacter sakazakii]EJG0831719.1 hypothetical protein [Cronobacter sakazakii]ELY4087386.1 hypothetical protein [Cronobacter sakazakii]ELY4540720.1 hypothetical protein [Cronobacter sakazakii]ELY5805118.1 hypothetical protein [Cronobacter sakazakii]